MQRGLTQMHQFANFSRRAKSASIRLFMASLLCVLAILAPTRAGALTYCVNYSATPDLEELKRFDELILSPYARIDIHSLIRSAQLPYAYLSVVEVADDAHYRDQVRKSGIHTVGENTTWNSAVMDVSDPKWADFVVDVLAKDAVDKGFRGFFLDTADSIAIAEKAEPARKAQFRQGLVNLIKRLKSTYPKRNIILNRGFPLLADLVGTIDGVLVESLFRKYDFKSKSYIAEELAGTKWLLNTLAKVKDAGLDVYILDYVAPTEPKLAREVAKQIEELGFHAFISTVELDGKYLNLPPQEPALPADAEEVTRRVLALFGNNEKNVEFLVQFPLDSGVSRFLQMPLEYYGYDIDYVNLWKEKIPDPVPGHHGVIILDRELTIPPQLENAMADWLIRMKNEGRKILFFGKIPFENEDVRKRIVKAFQIHGSGRSVDAIHRVKFLHQSQQTGFETPNQLTPADFHDLRAPTISRIWLSLEATTLKGTNYQYDPVFVTAWGGAMLDPHVTFMRPDEDEMWKIDPYAFMDAFLGLRNFPAPDTTTRDGVRIFFAHIDGDGFRHKSEVERGRRSGDLLFEKVVDKYPFPITLSIIEAEIRGIIFNSDPGVEKLMVEQARNVFKSEKVEAGSHSYSHPYYWVNPDRTLDIYERQNLKLERKEGYGQKVDYHREVVGSIRYIEENLLPPAKRVEIMLWSGNCRPGEEALRWCREIGVENMNGGDTAITRKNPSLTRVFGNVVPWGKEYHIYCAHQNENVYRFRWKGGADPDSVFWSGFLLALDSFKKTEEPRRLKPVNIYYHWYSGDNLPSMNALKQLYEWCVTQELHSLTAAPFSRLARDARDTKVYRTGAREWIVHNDGFCRTFKFPWTGEVPDLSRSDGVTGWRRVKDLIYVHTSGRRNTKIALSLNPAPRLFLESSSSEIRFHELGTGRVRFHVKDFRPCRVVLAGASPNLPVWVSFNGNRHPYQADESGRLKMEFPQEATVTITPR